MWRQRLHHNVKNNYLEKTKITYDNSPFGWRHDDHFADGNSPMHWRNAIQWSSPATLNSKRKQQVRNTLKCDPDVPTCIGNMKQTDTNQPLARLAFALCWRLCNEPNRCLNVLIYSSVSAKSNHATPRCPSTSTYSRARDGRRGQTHSWISRSFITSHTVLHSVQGGHRPSDEAPQSRHCSIQISRTYALYGGESRFLRLYIFNSRSCKKCQLQSITWSEKVTHITNICTEFLSAAAATDLWWNWSQATFDTLHPQQQIPVKQLTILWMENRGV